MKVRFFRDSKLLVLVSLVAMAKVTVSCKDDDKGVPRPEYGKVAFLNGSFASDSLNFLVDSKKVNTSLIAYGDSIHYLDVSVGDRAFEIKAQNDTSLVKKTFKIERDKNYTLLVSNSKDGKTVELVQVTDDLGLPSADKAKVRFVHLSPDLGKLDFANGDSTVIADVDYLSASAFKELEAQKTNFHILDKETKDTLLSVNDVDLSKGKIYTIWLSGLKNDADDGQKLKVHTFVNK